MTIVWHDSSAVNGSLSRGKLNTGDSGIDFKLNPEMGQKSSHEDNGN